MNFYANILPIKPAYPFTYQLVIARGSPSVTLSAYLKRTARQNGNFYHRAPRFIQFWLLDTKRAKVH